MINEDIEKMIKRSQVKPMKEPRLQRYNSLGQLNEFNSLNNQINYDNSNSLFLITNSLMNQKNNQRNHQSHQIDQSHRQCHQSTSESIVHQSIINSQDEILKTLRYLLWKQKVQEEDEIIISEWKILVSKITIYLQLVLIVSKIIRSIFIFNLSF